VYPSTRFFLGAYFFKVIAYVGSETGQTQREKKVIILRELHRAIIYTTKMSKQVTKSHVRDTVYMYNIN